MVPDLAGHSSFFPSSWYRTKIPGKRNATVVELGRSPVNLRCRASKTRDRPCYLVGFFATKKYFSLVKNKSSLPKTKINSTGKRVSNDTVGTIYFPFFYITRKKGWLEDYFRFDMVPLQGTS